MAYVRTKKVKEKKYYYVVKSKWVNGTSKQEVLEYVGPVDKHSKEEVEKIAESYND